MKYPCGCQATLFKATEECGKPWPKCDLAFATWLAISNGRYYP